MAPRTIDPRPPPATPSTSNRQLPALNKIDLQHTAPALKEVAMAHAFPPVADENVPVGFQSLDVEGLFGTPHGSQWDSWCMGQNYVGLNCVTDTHDQDGSTHLGVPSYFNVIDTSAWDLDAYDFLLADSRFV